MEKIDFKEAYLHALAVTICQSDLQYDECEEWLEEHEDEITGDFEEDIDNLTEQFNFQ